MSKISEPQVSKTSTWAQRQNKQHAQEQKTLSFIKKRCSTFLAQMLQQGFCHSFPSLLLHLPMDRQPGSTCPWWIWLVITFWLVENNIFIWKVERTNSRMTTDLNLPERQLKRKDWQVQEMVQSLLEQTIKHNRPQRLKACDHHFATSFRNLGGGDQRFKLFSCKFSQGWLQPGWKVVAKWAKWYHLAS